MIKQFNFYDIYGYLLPGMVLFALLWLPIGIITQKWPEQDLSKALFVGVLAYVAGLIIQGIAESAVPSDVVDKARHRRKLSEYLMDADHPTFTAQFKLFASAAVKSQFGLDLRVTENGTGSGPLFRDRQAAFFQARSRLVIKNGARYAEQFQGMYALMRGLGCSFFAGGVYIAGWAVASRSCDCVRNPAQFSVLVALLFALCCALVAFFQERRKKIATLTLTIFLLLAFLGVGILAGSHWFASGGEMTAVRIDLMLWAGSVLSMVAAMRCFSSYKGFAANFAETIWRDFCADLSVCAAGGNAANDEDSD